MLKFCLLVASLAAAANAGCTSPKVSASSYTPGDSQVLNAIPYIAEFSLACSNGEKPVLYAMIEGALYPVTQALEGDNYQVSWVKDLRSAKTGDHSVALYDQEAYNVLSRALERGETATSEPIATIVVNYAGSYNGPLFNSEHFALALSALVFYLAFSSRSALLA